MASRTKPKGRTRNGKRRTGVARILLGMGVPRGRWRRSVKPDDVRMQMILETLGRIALTQTEIAVALRELLWVTTHPGYLRRERTVAVAAVVGSAAAVV